MLLIQDTAVQATAAVGPATADIVRAGLPAMQLLTDARIQVKPPAIQAVAAETASDMQPA